MARTAEKTSPLTVEVILAARCTLSTAGMRRGVIRAIVRAFTHRNGHYDKLRRMGYNTRGVARQIVHAWEYPARRLLQVPRGGAPRLRTLLEECGYRVRWVDRRLVLKPVTFGGTLKARPNQAPCAHALFKKQQGLLRGQTGTGKTETLLCAAIKAGQPTLVIVWNKDLQGQWIDRIVKYGIAKPREIGGIGGLCRRAAHGKISVAMQQSLVKHVKEWAPHYGTVILDEAHRAPAETYSSILNLLPAKYRWGATADEERSDGLECITYDCFGEVVAEIESAETIIEPTLHLVKTPYTDAQYEEDRQFSPFINRLVVDRDRNRLIRKHLRRRLKAGRRVLFFTERVEAALMWMQVVEDMGFTAGILIGGKGGHRPLVEQTVAGLKDGTCNFAAATTYADVGHDWPLLDCAFVSCPTGLKRMNQQVGRVVRPAPRKRDAEIWFFWDNLVDGIDRKGSKARRRWKNFVVHEREQTQ